MACQQGLHVLMRSEGAPSFMDADSRIMLPLMRGCLHWQLVAEYPDPGHRLFTMAVQNAIYGGSRC